MNRRVSLLFWISLTCVLSGQSQQQTYTTSDLSLSISDKGNIVQLSERPAGSELLFPGSPAPLLSVQVDGNILLPVTMQEGDHLKYTGGTEAILYSRNWVTYDTVMVEPATLSLAKGKHTLTVEGEFDQNEKSTLSVEIRFMGQPELLPAEDPD